MIDIAFLDSTVQMPLMKLPVRSTVVSLASGKILISPGSQLDSQKLKSIAPITDLVAPNLFHGAGLKKAAAEFPTARIWRPEGAQVKDTEINKDRDVVLSAKNWPYQEELQLITIAGMPKVNETVFFHKKSKSLIITDLCFNMLNQKGFGSWLILNLFGTYEKFAMSKFFLKFASDRNKFVKSLEDIMSLDFDNIILSHGENIVGAGKEKLRLAFAERNLLT